MNIQQFRTLIAVHDHPTFADAAASLFVTPAAVSQQMRQLEEELQVALFDRTTRPPRLNAHALGLIEEARDLISQFDALVDRARAPGEIAGVLTLGSATGITTALVPRALAALRDRYPRMQVRIEEGISEQLIGRVRRRELDAALITAPMEPEPDMKMLTIVKVPMVVVMPSTNKSKTWQDAVMSAPFLHITRRSGLAKLIDSGLRRGGVSVRDAMELDSSESICTLVEAGLGVGVVPKSRVDMMDSPALRTLPFGTPQVVQTVALIERQITHRSGLADILYRQLLDLTGAPTEAES